MSNATDANEDDYASKASAVIHKYEGQYLGLYNADNTQYAAIVGLDELATLASRVKQLEAKLSTPQVVRVVESSP